MAVPICNLTMNYKYEKTQYCITFIIQNMFWINRGHKPDETFNEELQTHHINLINI